MMVLGIIGAILAVVAIFITAEVYIRNQKKPELKRQQMLKKLNFKSF